MMTLLQNLKDLQDVLKLDQHRLLKCYSIRFLSIFPVVDRLLELYEAILKLFRDEIPQNHPNVRKQPRTRRIIEALTSKFFLPTLTFLQYSLEMFQKYEKLFQRESPTIHLLYGKQVEIYRNTLMQFCELEKIQLLKSGIDLIKFDLKSLLIS